MWAYRDDEKGYLSNREDNSHDFHRVDFREPEQIVTLWCEGTSEFHHQRKFIVALQRGGIPKEWFEDYGFKDIATYFNFKEEMVKVSNGAEELLLLQSAGRRVISERLNARDEEIAIRWGIKCDSCSKDIRVSKINARKILDRIITMEELYVGKVAGVIPLYEAPVSVFDTKYLKPLDL